MISVEVTISGIEDAQRRVSGLHEAIRFRLRSKLPQLGDEIAAKAASLAPRKSGELAGDIEASLRERDSGFTETIRPSRRAFYGQWQESGLDTERKPARRRGIVGVRTRMVNGVAMISARRGLMKRTSGWSAHRFQLPAHPFMRPAVESLRSRIEQQIKAAVDTAVERG